VACSSSVRVRESPSSRSRECGCVVRETSFHRLSARAGRGPSPVRSARAARIQSEWATISTGSFSPRVPQNRGTPASRAPQPSNDKPVADSSGPTTCLATSAPPQPLIKSSLRIDVIGYHRRLLLDHVSDVGSDGQPRGIPDPRRAARLSPPKWRPPGSANLAGRGPPVPRQTRSAALPDPGDDKAVGIMVSAFAATAPVLGVLVILPGATVSSRRRSILSPRRLPCREQIRSILLQFLEAMPRRRTSACRSTGPP